MFLSNVSEYRHSIDPLPSAKNSSDSDFNQQLCSAKSAAAKFTIPLKNENYVFYIGHGDGQDVYVEYAEDSTPTDPVVHITGHSLTGAFDFKAHINDIDPRNASYAEMCALIGYQKQSGTFDGNAALGLCRPTPLGMPVGDFTQKTDYLSKTQQYLSSGKFSQSIFRQGNELLELYQKIASRSYKDHALSDSYLDRMTYELLQTMDSVSAVK